MKQGIEDLSGRKVVVIGGSGGIGACISRMLADAKADIVVHGGHRKGALEQVAGECRRRGARCETVLLELKGPKDVSSLLGSSVPDILVVALGPIRWTGVSKETAGGWQDMALLNLAIPGALVSACLPEMKQRRFGRIILFGASRGEVAPASLEATAYTAAKSGLVSLARSVAKDASGYDVSCNVLCPGYVDTEYLSDGQRERFARRAPSGRLSSPEDIAGLALYLCGSSARVINGAVINAGQGLA